MDFLLDGKETERLTFRKIKISDFNAWLPFHQDKRSSAFWKGLPQNPLEACKQDIERTHYRYKNNLGGKNALILKKTGQFIGQCGLLVQEVDGIEELEVGYSILPIYWGQGYAKEAALKCKSHAVKNHLATSLISIIQVSNVPSQKVAMHMGMRIDKTTVYHSNEVYIYRVAI